MKLKNQSAIVTGAASGIGKEIALVLAREAAPGVSVDQVLAATEAELLVPANVPPMAV